eukprot:TRINITY_DN8655_c0_g2_i1.p1 TRINITY_DN8655_c0_g2~~TRINITY_DN8655_c0_g2_i1.p1  ORF type:complete len:1322 (-),score=408.20 TRINITY_DN8655_c0_g2_i1:159-4124(-)
MLGHCEDNEVLCWDGRCVKDASRCATRSTCPPNAEVKCSDGSCVDDVRKCADHVQCPPHAPYRCANGACRTAASECPTLVTCPAQLPILCPDGSCKKAKYHCSKQNRVCPAGLIICPDGSCARSSILCQTQPACAPGFIRCWDGVCASTIEKCTPINLDTEACPEALSTKCPDGSCAKKTADCPTQIICPVERPIRCDDGNCRGSVSECINDACPAGLFRCPDGSCTNPTTGCGTPITCSKLAPYKCADNTCKANPRDCIRSADCPVDKLPILCPDGSCAKTRAQCRPLERCPVETPVRCPDLNCHATSEQCQPIDGCPYGYFQCSDGSCAPAANLCPVNKCPAHLSHKCKNGFCVAEAKYCDSEANGCPFDRPLKCADGLCVKDKCSEESEKKCPEGRFQCPDGACATDKAYCPNAFGCPPNAPFRCSSGECVNLNTTKCDIAICPKTAPIKCLDGLCVTSRSYCPSFLSIEDYEQCKEFRNLGNIVPCADGACVSSAEQCKPLFKCPNNQFRCKDGSCRLLESLCPRNIKGCPETKKFRCQNGACARSEADCPTENGCPSSHPMKCQVSGECALNEKACEDIDKKARVRFNGCPEETPFRCGDKCTVDEAECQQSGKCPKVTCADRSCAETLEQCPKEVKCNATHPVICPTKNCARAWSECKTIDECPVDRPIKCADGKCHKMPYFPGVKSDSLCQPIVRCPKYKPFLCADGECVGDEKLCRTLKPCPIERPFRCFDGTCSAKEGECKAREFCPLASPVLCQDGSCVSSPVECQVLRLSSCPRESPYRCFTGVCVKMPFECTAPTAGKQGTVEKRELQELTDAGKQSHIDAGCSTELPVRCTDGSCRVQKRHCPAIEGCNDPAKPYRCHTGLCTESKLKCQQTTPANFDTCPAGSNRCEDGVCRVSCLHFDGCPLNRPWHCPNGYCGKSLADCAGGSGDCPQNKPFRCADGTCISAMTKCKRSARTTNPENTLLSISPLETKDFFFIQDPLTTVKYAKLTIPAGSFLPPLGTAANSSDNLNTQALQIQSVPESLIRHFENVVHEDARERASQVFKLSEGKLEFHHTVRSAIFHIDARLREDTVSYRFPVIIDMFVDLPYDNTNGTRDADALNDICLAKADRSSKQWVCQNRVNKSSVGIGWYNSNFTTDGIYAFIFNPLPPQPAPVKEECGFLCTYGKLILFGFCIAIPVLALIAYLFSRVLRYVDKYRLAKESIANMQKQIQELSHAQNDILGTGVDSGSYVSNSSEKMSKRIQEINEALEKMRKREAILETAHKDLIERNKILKSEAGNLGEELKRVESLPEAEVMELTSIKGRDMD